MRRHDGVVGLSIGLLVLALVLAGAASLVARSAAESNAPVVSAAAPTDGGQTEPTAPAMAADGHNHVH